MCFSHAKGHISFLYISCMKFPTNRFVGNFCPFFNDCNFYIDFATFISVVIKSGLIR